MLLIAGAGVLALGMFPHPHNSADHPESQPLPIEVAARTTQPPTKQPAAPLPALPRMQLEGQFAGPLKDTIIQRLRDPRDGTVCYIYLPITVQHSPPTASGAVEYGPNAIGSISCFPPQPVPRH